MEKIENTIKEAETKLAEIRSAKKELEAERALRNAPICEDKELRTKAFADVQKAMQEKRSITLGGTGNISLVRELKKVLTAKKDILGRFNYFYGPNSQTIIPVWGSDLGRAVPVQADGTFKASSGKLATKNLNPIAFCKSIPVADETLKLSAVNFETELNNIIADVYADTLAWEVFNGSGEDGHFSNIYAGATPVIANKLSVSALAKSALEVSDKTDTAFIVLNPKVYNAILDSAGSTATDKAYVKQLVESKSIEGVPVILTSYASDGTDGNYALIGDLKNYAIALADELTIEPKKTVGSLTTTFDVSMYVAGTTVVPENFWALKVTE